MLKATSRAFLCILWIIDLGPEGGDKGGFVLYEGTGENLLKEEKNDTAICLKTFLKQ